MSDTPEILVIIDSLKYRKEEVLTFSAFVAVYGPNQDALRCSVRDIPQYSENIHIDRHVAGLQPRLQGL